MAPETFMERIRSWLAGKLFLLAGKLDAAYDVWLDDAPRRGDSETCQTHIPTWEGDTLICDDCGVSLREDGGTW